ncbi:MAG: hypothetical protein HY831_05370 [Candidatus Aenigmarchaeota archaeon]|nr:hypothetical protein [Candidatus Aenigmarchaeota archaeon]
MLNYRKILTKTQKPEFMKSKEVLKKLSISINVDKIDLILNNIDDELEPIQTASMAFPRSDLFENSNKAKSFSFEEAASWIEDRVKEKKGVIIHPGDFNKSLPFIVKTLSIVKKPTPIILKSNGYYSEATANFLKKIIDINIIDFQYISNDCSSVLIGNIDYPDVAKRNMLLAQHSGHLLLNHKILPSHIECDSKPILEWIKANLDSYELKISGSYKPDIGSHREIARDLTITEYNDVMKHARMIGLNI